MFDIFSWQHIIIMLVVALVVVGPKDLPRLMHMAGKWAGKARAMANEFRKSFDEMARQTELDELRKEIEDLKKNNPISDLASSMDSMTADLNQAVEAQPGAASAAHTPAEAAFADAVPDIGPEPRSGEMQVTDAAPVNGPSAP